MVQIIFQFLTHNWLYYDAYHHGMIILTCINSNTDINGIFIVIV